MVNAMEGTLHGFKNKTNCYEDILSEHEREAHVPALISDTSSDGDSFTEEEEVMMRPPAAATIVSKKKRSATIPNFLFRSSTKKKIQEDALIKRNQSLNEADTWVQRKPILIS